MVQGGRDHEWSSYGCSSSSLGVPVSSFHTIQRMVSIPTLFLFYAYRSTDFYS